MLICVQYQEKLQVNVKLIFQPAEENGQGTHIMLDGGIMENPKVDYFVMFHFVNDASAGMELNKGASSAAIGSVKLTIKGRSSHWCTYELGIDTIDAASRVLESIRYLNATYQTSSPFILGIGKISGGNAKNVVADETILEGSLRTCKIADYHELRNLLLSDLERI